MLQVCFLTYMEDLILQEKPPPSIENIQLWKDEGEQKFSGFQVSNSIRIHWGSGVADPNPGSSDFLPLIQDLEWKKRQFPGSGINIRDYISESKRFAQKTICQLLLAHLFANFCTWQPVLWIRIHFFRIRIRSVPLETNTDPDSGSGSGSRSNSDPGL